MSDRKTLSILGSTGSVGRSTVDLVASAPDRFQVKVLTAGKNAELLIQQARELRPELVAIQDERVFHSVREALSPLGIKVLAGRQGILEAASLPVDWVMAAIVGVAGLEPVLSALASSRTVAIANKEPLVAAGCLVMREATRHGTRILPVDSEHNAIFQVFETDNLAAVEKIILTASGGPFRTWTLEQMEKATPDQAVAHPNWSMGRKISVDSASMVNKGLEVIEAHHLFGLPPEKIHVLIHPQSTIHSMVEYRDGSVLAQLGAADMRTPIAYALAWPNRMATTGQRLDWSRLGRLDFMPPDFVRFPALRLAYEALRQGSSACVTLNAANEAAVELFLGGRIGFGDISRLIEKALEWPVPRDVQTLDEILALDRDVRTRVTLEISGISRI